LAIPPLGRTVLNVMRKWWFNLNTLYTVPLDADGVVSPDLHGGPH